DLPSDPRTARQTEGKYNVKVDVASHYKFYLAFENTNLTDYVTEKLIHAFQSTSLPCYMGAPNIDDFLPHPYSVIKTADFKSPKHLAQHLHSLLRNDVAYAEYFAWKALPADQLQVPRSMRKRTCPYCEYDWSCRVCLRIHDLL